MGVSGIFGFFTRPRSERYRIFPAKPHNRSHNTNISPADTCHASADTISSRKLKYRNVRTVGTSERRESCEVRDTETAAKYVIRSSYARFMIKYSSKTRFSESCVAPQLSSDWIDVKTLLRTQIEIMKTALSNRVYHSSRNN